jgi:hypothetical protein
LDGLGLSTLKQDGHGVLRGLDRWSVIPYIHGRMRVVLLWVLFNSKVELV